MDEPEGIEHLELKPEQLRRFCDPADFDFECTDDIAPLEGFIGQERAIRAIEFGLAVDRPGYNIFVTGLTGTGKTTVIRSYVQTLVEKKGAAVLGLPALSDWCYVFNTTDQDRPKILRLPMGGGKQLRDEMNELVSALRLELSRALGSDEYRVERKALVDAGQAKQRQLFAQVERAAQAANLLLQISQAGVALVPLVDGKQMTQEAYAALSQEERDEVDKRRAPLWEAVQAAFEQVRSIERETAQKLQELQKKTAEFAISKPFNNLLTTTRDMHVARYIEEIRGYTLANLVLFRKEEEGEEIPKPPAAQNPPGRDPFIAYRVNVYVDNSGADGPPVVVETNPTWGNLFGRIERRAMMGAYFSDHTMLKPGSLARANGGYLIVNARELLTNPGVWEGLKRAIRNREVRLEDPAEALGLLAPQGLQPQPMPIDLKVIVTGENQIYQILSRMDEDFWEVFKVRADFDYQIDHREKHRDEYAAFVCSTCRQEKLRAFARDAVAKIVEHGSRAVNDQDRLSARFGILRDILIESDYWAGIAGSDLVRAEHVNKALSERIYRSDLMAQRLQEMIAEGTIMVDVEGEVVGQVNGLAVYDLGDIAFGKPSRITARTFMGRSGIVNIEREAKLSGNTHDKGVLILAGYLGSKYAQDRPLSVSASICFEQSYGGVDGDSASSTELYAIISSLSEIPIKQSVAVTGSVNQKGEIQPIGGVNEKIEGFFDVCLTMGKLDGQGVMIPRQNARNLMLREDVVEAAREGKFHVWSIGTIDEGLEVLTGMPAGERGPNAYPEGTVHRRVEDRLAKMADKLRKFALVGRNRGVEGTEVATISEPNDNPNDNPNDAPNDVPADCAERCLD